MAYVLGIDGGGSKTMAAVAGGSCVFTSKVDKGCNFNTVSREDGRAALREAVQGALASARIASGDISSVCAGVAGCASPELAATVSEILASLLPCASVRVV